MKWMKLLGISFFVCLFFTNCQKEEIIPIEKEIFPRSEPQMVPFKITGGTIGVFYGGTDCFVNGDTYFGTIPQVTYITGTATHIGLVDATKSYIEFLSFF